MFISIVLIWMDIFSKECEMVGIVLEIDIVNEGLDENLSSQPNLL